MFRIGGTQYEIYDGFQDQVRTFINDFPHKVDEYETLPNGEPHLDRAYRGVGVLSAKDAIDLGVTGPALRGSGVEWDIRKAKPYAAYADFQSRYRWASTATRTTGTWSAYRRCGSLHASSPRASKRSRWTTDGKMSKIIKPPVGDIYHSIEAPKGELGYYIVSDGSTQAYRARVRPPSFVNLQALRKLVTGHMVADVVAIIGTLDIVLGEIDR